MTAEARTPLEELRETIHELNHQIGLREPDYEDIPHIVARGLNAIGRLEAQEAARAKDIASRDAVIRLCAERKTTLKHQLQDMRAALERIEGEMFAEYDTDDSWPGTKFGKLLLKWRADLRALREPNPPQEGKT